MVENEQISKDISLSNITINEFLIEAVKILGETGSFDLDLLNLLINYIINEISSLNSSILLFQRNKMESNIVSNNIKDDDKPNDLPYFFIGQENEIQRKENLLMLMKDLEFLRYEINETLDRNKKFKERIIIFSRILERNIDLSVEEIENKINTIFYNQLGNDCPLLYRFIENKIHEL